jgi:hypothetical protein
VPGAPNEPTNTPTDLQNYRMILGSGATAVPNSFVFNDPGNTNPETQVRTNTASSFVVPTSGNQLGRVPYLGFAPTGMSNTTTQGDSLYNSFQAQIRHQFANGFLLQASYTWSKLMTNINSPEAGGGIAAPGNVLSGGASSNNPLDFAQQYGLASFNRPQRLIVAYSYDLPYKNQQGLTGHLFGGWTVSGVTTVQDGEPFTVTDSNAGTIYGAGGFGGGGVRAQLAAANTGKCNQYGVCQSVGVATSGSTTSRVISGLAGNCTPGASWINVSAYGACGPTGFSDQGMAPCIGGIVGSVCGAPGSFSGTGFGDSGVGSIMGPGQFNWDLSVFKNTKLTERTSIEFRAEFYNIWNHPQFNPPVNSAGDATFGEIQNSSVPPRIMQFALKFYF